MKPTLFILLLLGSFLNCQAQSFKDSLTQKLNKIQNLGYLPGFAVALVGPEGVLYQEGFGYADLETQKPFSIHTTLNIGSTSKTLLGIAIMQLVEAGKLSLDTEINDMLPFEIIHPFHPDIPITVAHLATHTSGLRDPWDYERTYLFSQKISLTKEQCPKGFYKYVKLYNSNSPMPVSEFIQYMTQTDGIWYKKKNFTRKKPGEAYHYSNLGAAIAGYIVETITGIPFTDYTQKKILKPLAMTSSGWNRSKMDSAQFASLYLSNDQKIPWYSLISYADGGLVTSVHDLAIYFREMIAGYNRGHSTLLNQSSFQTMMNAAFSSEKRESGIFWAINGKGEYGHSGGDPGIMTFMFFDPDTGYGRIIFTNKSDEGGNGFNQLVYIWKTLEDYIPKITRTARR